MGKKKRRPKVETYEHLHVCPHCGARNECATRITNHGPLREGAITICAECGELGILDASLAAQKIPPETLFELMLSNTWRLIEAAQTFVKNKHRWWQGAPPVRD